MTHAQRATTTEPYGPASQAHYADPGYQSDGKKRYPLDSEAHCRAAWSYINQADNAAQYSPEHLAAIKGRIKAAGRKYGIHFADDTEMASRWAGTDMFMRSFQLQDLAIRSGGDGRTVEAYAAVFGIPAEIRDPQGHYSEVIEPTAFNRTIANNAQRVGVFYNHGMSLHGTPSDRFSVPIGTPEQIKADNKGLLTVTRFAKTELADEILELIRSGGIAGYSFTGRLIRSDPNRPPRGGYGRGMNGDLLTVRRHELGLAEYGPTPLPAYSQAAIVGMRAALRALSSSTPEMDPDDDHDTSVDTEPVADDPPTHSVRQLSRKQEMQAARSAFLLKHPGS